MKYGIMIAVSGLLLLCTNGCAQKERVPAPRDSTSMADDHYEVPPPRTNIPEVMRAKLAHAQAILEAIAMGDFVLVETNAMDLRRISQSSEWLVVDTPSYHAYSETFRNVANDLIAHARQENLDAVTADYANLTNSCVACHSYLRSERPYLNMPGRVSMR